MGYSSPLQCCSGLRRIDGGLPQTGTDNGGGVASEDDKRVTNSLNRNFLISPLVKTFKI
jgi:hypothetical protein